MPTLDHQICPMDMAPWDLETPQLSDWQERERGVSGDGDNLPSFLRAYSFHFGEPSNRQDLSFFSSHSKIFDPSPSLLNLVAEI